MNTTTSVVATASIVTVGRMSAGKPMDVKIVVGAGFLTLGLVVLPDELAAKFAFMILIVASFTYVPSIANKAGLTKLPAPKWG